MNYWPLSVLASSPLLPAAYAYEVSLMNRCLPSRGAYYACFDVARRTAPVAAPNMVIVQSVGAPGRCMYVGTPEPEEWLRLERVSVMEYDDYMFVLVNAIH